MSGFFGRAGKAAAKHAAKYAMQQIEEKQIAERVGDAAARKAGELAARRRDAGERAGVPEKRESLSTPPASGEKRFKGLPPLKPPGIPEGNRAVLVACAKTGRASWANFEPRADRSDPAIPISYYRWVGNAPAVPDLEAAKRDQKDAASATGGTPAMPAEEVFWGSYACGVCETDATPVPGHEPYSVWQCGTCGTLRCAGGFEQIEAEAWRVRCPGCGVRGVLRAHQETNKIGEYDSEAGRPGREGLGSGRPPAAGELR